MSQQALTLDIGIDEFTFFHARPCPQCLKTVEVVFSCLLTGHFLPAAISDDLKFTVDYDALCQQVERWINQTSLLQNEIASMLGPKIRDFSPLIRGGNFSLIMRCHETFRLEKALI